jgi:hypothetical protein
MPVMVGIYDTQSEAERAYVRLRESGLPESAVALVAGFPTERAPQTAGELMERQQAGIVPDGEVEVTHPVDPAADAVPDHAASAGVTPPTESDEPGLDNAALGSAIGLMAGAGLGGPLGAIAGAAAGAGIGAWLTNRGASHEEIRSYEHALANGRYLVAVDTPEATSDLRAILDSAGAERVEVR